MAWDHESGGSNPPVPTSSERSSIGGAPVSKTGGSRFDPSRSCCNAAMAEMEDAPGLGPGGLLPVQVQILVAALRPTFLPG